MISRMVQFKLLCVPVRVFQEMQVRRLLRRRGEQGPWTRVARTPARGAERTLDKGRQNPEQGCRGTPDRGEQGPWTRVARTPCRGAEEPRTGVSKDPGQGSPEPRAGVRGTFINLNMQL